MLKGRFAEICQRLQGRKVSSILCAGINGIMSDLLTKFNNFRRGSIRVRSKIYFAHFNITATNREQNFYVS